MEVDGVEENCVKNHSESAKFANLKAFVNAARDFESTHSEAAVNMMTRYLGLIASSCDLSIFSPGRIEVCAFFSSLWRVMRDGRGPHWAGVAVLARASIDTNARHALTHTYKFMPILARLLSEAVSNDKKIKLLSVMQDISYGIKISWQECYLARLMYQLTDWITQPMTEPQHRTIGQKSLTVLVNVCYGNLPAIYALMRTVDTKNFVSHLITLKDGGYGGVEVCRLLLCLSSGTRGSANTKQPDVTHGYLSCTMRTFNKAIVEKDSTELLHSYTFLNDLCSDNDVKSYVLTYPDFSTGLQDCLKNIDGLCKVVPDDMGEPETSCLRHVLKFITALVNLDLFSLRGHHCELVCLCMKSSSICLPESLELFAAIVTQYRDEGALPRELTSVISDGLPALLVPPALEPGKAGLQWLQVVGALCESSETQERVLQQVTPDSFEDTLYGVLQYTSQNGAVGSEAGAQCVVLACRAGLALAPLSRDWEAAFARTLAHHQVRKLLCAGLVGSHGQRRKQILQIIKHHYFPSDQMNQIFGESLHNISDVSVESVSPRVDADGDTLWASERLTPTQVLSVNVLISTLNEALRAGKINDIATSSVMELYGYKMSCLEQRLHSHAATMQSASEHAAALQHALALLQATNAAQQDVLYTTQMQNEKYKKQIEELHKQREDGEKTMQSFRAKLAGERLDKENQKKNLQNEFRSQLASLESDMKARETELEERYKQLELDNKALQKKLEQQTSKNSELASVLIKFEERVKQKDKKLEEAAAADGALRREVDQKDNVIKQLEKTIVERDNRLYLLTSQLEEMKRVQEMVAKLMSKSTSATQS